MSSQPLQELLAKLGPLISVLFRLLRQCLQGVARRKNLTLTAIERHMPPNTPRNTMPNTPLRAAGGRALNRIKRRGTSWICFRRLQERGKNESSSPGLGIRQVGTIKSVIWTRPGKSRLVGTVMLSPSFVFQGTPIQEILWFHLRCIPHMDFCALRTVLG